MWGNRVPVVVCVESRIKERKVTMSEMKISASGLAHLKTVEAFVPTLYNDGPKRNTGHCTIGYGHLVHYEPCDSVKYPSESQFINGITIKKATVILLNDVAIAEKSVNRLVTVPMTQNQYDALVSFVFNVGSKGFASSTLLKVINARQIERAPSAFRMWNKTGGRVSPGLINRRQAEIDLFLQSQGQSK